MGKIFCATCKRDITDDEHWIHAPKGQWVRVPLCVACFNDAWNFVQDPKSGLSQDKLLIELSNRTGKSTRFIKDLSFVDANLLSLEELEIFVYNLDCIPESAIQKYLVAFLKCVVKTMMSQI